MKRKDRFVGKNDVFYALVVVAMFVLSSFAVVSGLLDLKDGASVSVASEGAAFSEVVAAEHYARYRAGAG